jgi:hypothetical protein
MISASFESVCCCGCRRPYRVGAALEKTRAGWVLASCVDARVVGTAPAGSDAEKLEILARAREVRDIAEAADRIRAMRAGGGAF